MDESFKLMAQCAREEKKTPGALNQYVALVAKCAAMTPSPYDDRPALKTATAVVEGVALVHSRVGERVAKLCAACATKAPRLSALLAAVDAQDASLRLDKPTGKICALSGVEADELVSARVSTNGKIVAADVGLGAALEFVLRVFAYRHVYARAVEHEFDSPQALWEEFTRNEAVIDAVI